MRRLRNWFLTGLAVTLPTALTCWMLYKLFNFLDDILQPLVQRTLGFEIPGLGFISVILLVFLAGSFASNFFGHQVLNGFEALVNRVPLAGKIYVSIKQILVVLVDQQGDAFKSVVVFQYPRQGLWALGFITRETSPGLRAVEEGRVFNVFIPTSPNPTSGFVLMIPESELRHTTLSVEEALKVVISGGAYMPDELPADPPTSIRGGD
jgi:uncharacterized membrane protein